MPVCTVRVPSRSIAFLVAFSQSSAILRPVWKGLTAIKKVQQTCLMYTFFRSLHCFFNLSIQQISTIGTSELQILPAPVATLWRSNYSIRRWISEAKAKRMWAGRDTWLWTLDGFGSISIHILKRIQTMYYYVYVVIKNGNQDGFPLLNWPIWWISLRDSHWDGQKIRPSQRNMYQWPYWPKLASWAFHFLPI